MTRFFIILILISSLNSFGQTKQYSSAKLEFDSGNYIDAQSLYEKAARKKKNKAYFGIIQFQIAECIRMEYDSISRTHYLNCLDLFKKNSHGTNILKKVEILKILGLSYFYLGDNHQALVWFDRLLKANPGDTWAMEMIEKLSP